MKQLFSLLTMMIFPATIFSQATYDCLPRGGYCIMRSDSVGSSAKVIKSYSLKNPAEAGFVFGTDYNFTRYHDPLYDKDFSKLVYPGGLELIFSETDKSLFTFKITSGIYTLHFRNGVSIRTGMKTEELARLFPNSFAQRENYGSDPKTGKIRIKVYGCLSDNGKTVFTDSCLIFILSKSDGVLLEFFEFVPG